MDNWEKYFKDQSKKINTGSSLNQLNDFNELAAEHEKIIDSIEKKCDNCIVPSGTRCESAPGNCPYSK